MIFAVCMWNVHTKNMNKIVKRRKKTRWWIAKNVKNEVNKTKYAHIIFYIISIFVEEQQQMQFVLCVVTEIEMVEQKKKRNDWPEINSRI